MQWDGGGVAQGEASKVGRSQITQGLAGQGKDFKGLGSRCSHCWGPADLQVSEIT